MVVGNVSRKSLKFHNLSKPLFTSDYFFCIDTLGDYGRRDAIEAGWIN
jgi:hypothetical protein